MHIYIGVIIHQCPIFSSSPTLRVGNMLGMCYYHTHGQVDLCSYPASSKTSPQLAVQVKRLNPHAILVVFQQTYSHPTLHLSGHRIAVLQVYL